VRRHLSYANVISTLALFLVLAGGLAWALERNSVKSRHIARNQVRAQDTSDALRLECPGGTRYHEGACIETARRPFTAQWATARDDCVDDGRRLPDLAELATFRLEPGVTLASPEEWTSQVENADNNVAVAWQMQEDGSTNVTSVTIAHPYRCVAPAKR
jgi:hypothetical protein